MDLLHSDFKKGNVTLRVTDSDDLWYLSHLIDPGDIVKGKTTRKIKIGESENAKTVKKTLILKIEAETIDFQEQVLRINGKVQEGLEEVPKESYHALSLEVGTEFTLEKPQWLAYQRQKLQEACLKKYSYLLCLLDREEALFALTKKRGYALLLNLQGDVPKKAQKTEVKGNFQEELIKKIVEYNERFTPEKIIIASPAFYKDDLFKIINSPTIKEKIVLVPCSDVSERGIDEVIKRPELAIILKESRAREEQILLDLLLEHLQKNTLACYGWDEVQRAVAAGAVQHLLVTDNFIHKLKEEGKYILLDEIMTRVDNLRGEVHIFTSELESGRKLQGLGGIAAVLRYKLQW
ncbi:mRNA surveillance protein pelota [Candidatus Woesearchaeota archaeon]|nr:mRNA surveillance protein pelota [Candidatus Woesearchaeota archaeon]